MDTTVRLGPLKFSLRTTIDHHGPSIHSGHYTASINCCKKHSIATITQLRSWELLNAKTPILHMLYYMNWLIHDFWTRTGGWEFDRSHGAGTPSPSHWQQVEEQAPKPVCWMMCFLLITFVPVQKLCVNIFIYIYMHFLNEFCFIWFTNCVLLSDDNSLIPGCLWLLAFVLNNTFLLGIWCSTIPHQDVVVPGPSFRISDPFMSDLATHLIYSIDILQGGFRLCSWLSLRRLVSWINHLPPACWSTLWKSIFKTTVGLQVWHNG